MLRSIGLLINICFPDCVQLNRGEIMLLYRHFSHSWAGWKMVGSGWGICKCFIYTCVSQVRMRRKDTANVLWNGPIKWKLTVRDALCLKISSRCKKWSWKNCVLLYLQFIVAVRHSGAKFRIVKTDFKKSLLICYGATLIIALGSWLPFWVKTPRVYFQWWCNS